MSVSPKPRQHVERAVQLGHAEAAVVRAGKQKVEKMVGVSGELLNNLHKHGCDALKAPRIRVNQLKCTQSDLCVLVWIRGGVWTVGTVL
jgi:hypothetical protein